MKVIEFINNMFGLANGMLDFVFLVGGLILLFAYPVYFFVTNLKKYTKEQKGRELLSQAIILFLLVLLLGAFWFLPEILLLIIAYIRRLTWDNLLQWIQLQWNQWDWAFSSWRWLTLFAGFLFFAFRLGREYGQNRWKRSILTVGIILLLGWLLGRWMGILLVSAPLLAAYYASLHDLALIVMPTSNPEERAEQKKRINTFVSYTWGIQSPITVVDGHAWKKYEPRIPGDITWSFSDFPFPIIKNLDWRPGLVWTPSHQAVAISGGSKFKRVDGPGVTFTGKLERLDQIFDLRLQLRSKEIEAVSKDGIHFIVRFFTAFRLDNEEWERERYNLLRRQNPLLRGGNRLSHTKGSFPYSNVRVQATLGVTSTRATPGDPLVYWDQWAMNTVEDQTRQAISQKNLDEMWRPSNDYKFANALDNIAKEIKENADLILRAAGILLVVARVVNFRFLPKDGAKEGEMDEISKQQLATWVSEWERKRSQKLTKAQAQAEYARQEARVYAESLLLNTMVESLQKAHALNDKLPPHIIAMLFLSALQDYAHKQPLEGNENETVRKKMSELRNTFKTWQEDFFPEEQ